MSKKRVTITLPSELVEILEQMREVKIKNIEKSIIKPRSSVYESILLIGITHYWDNKELVEGLNITQSEIGEIYGQIEKSI